MLKSNTTAKFGAWRDGYIATWLYVDALMICLTVAAAQLIRFGLGSGELKTGDVSVPYWLVGAVLGIVWWVWLGLCGARDERLIGCGVEESKQVIHATLALFGTIAIFSYAFDIPTARGYVVSALPLGIVLLIAGRGHLRQDLVRQRRNGVAVSRTLVVGNTRDARERVRSLEAQPASGIDPVAVYAPAAAGSAPPSCDSATMPPNLLPPGHEPSVGGIVTACREHRIETLVLSASAPLDSSAIRHLSWYLADARIRLILDTGLTDIAGPRLHTQLIAGLPLIHVSTPRMSRGRLLIKRSMDVTGSVAALLLLSPVLLALAVIVKAHDSGPVIFAQERIGLDGHRFTMLKFRSMYTDAEKRQTELMAANECTGGVLFKMRNDPRITRPGRWMRQHSLDELPQFLNVLKGEMSLVGPRPPLPSEVAQYEEHVHRRLRVKPGITGLWQISGRSELNWDQAVRLDLYYVENWSPLQDVIILARTVKAVLSKDGAY